MNSSRAIVLASGGLMLVFVALQPGGLAGNYKKTWAAGVVLLALSLLADVWPDGAGPIAILVVLALAYRQKGALGGLLAKQQAGPPGTKGPQTNVTPAQRAAAAPSTSNPGGPAGTTGPVG